MPQRLVLHIGTAKTGSTAIQASLARAHSELLAAGILYPKTGRGRFPGHPHLAWEAAGDPLRRPRSGGVDDLVTEIEKAPARTVVLSSEVFGTDPARGERAAAWARRLSDRLGVSNVQVVAYVRPQWEYLESSYVQRVKTGRVYRRFPDQLERDLRTDRFDYVRVFEPWREAFGEGLTVRPYTRAALVGGDLVEDFRTTVGGLPDLPAAAHEPLNPRLGARATEMLRALREALNQRGLASVGRLDRVFLLARGALAAGLRHDEPFYGLTPALVERVRAHFEVSNEVFVERFMGGEDGGLFESPTTVPPPSSWTLEDASTPQRLLFSAVLAGAAGVTRVQTLTGRPPLDKQA